jgi:hypothetical protein
MLIIHFLDNFFKLYYCNSIVNSNVLKIKNTIYLKDKNSKESKGFLGFFDWLRITESKIVGIRICYLEDQPYNQILQQFSYVTPTFENRCMEILFKGESYNPEFSGDQDFTNNFVYKSDNADYLFTFGLDHLDEEEIDSLLQYSEMLNESDLIEGD